MPTHPARRRAAFSCALAATLLLAAAVQDPNKPAPQGNEPSAPPQGHVVLVVEGTVKALRVTTAVAKPDAWAGTPKTLVSEFSLVMLDAGGKELQRVPLDLSKFETDESKVDAPVVVKGCELKSPKIGVLCNIPARNDVATYRFVRGERAIGEVDAASMQRMVEEARR